MGLLIWNHAVYKFTFFFFNTPTLYNIQDQRCCLVNMLDDLVTMKAHREDTDQTMITCNGNHKHSKTLKNVI